MQNAFGQNCNYRLMPIMLFSIIFPPLACATGLPYRAGNVNDLKGIWRQVGAVAIDRDLKGGGAWSKAKQFFWFLPDGKFKHLLVDPDAQPDRRDPTPAQKKLMESTPPIQSITWQSRSIAWLKHPDRPPQRVEFGIYVRDTDSGPLKDKLKPRAGDMIIVFYNYKDPNKAVYYRLLRKLSDE